MVLARPRVYSPPINCYFFYFNELEKDAYNFKENSHQHYSTQGILIGNYSYEILL